MLRFNKSEMHNFYILTFFKGEKKAKEGLYFYKETNSLFAEENLGVNLIEYDDLPLGGLDFKNNKDLQNILGLIKKEDDHIFSIADVQITNLDSEIDLEIQFNEKMMDVSRIDAMKYGLSSYAGIKVLYNEVSHFEKPVVINLDLSNTSYIRVLVSKDFLRRGSKKLSQRLVSAFDPRRYVDTNIAIFMLMVGLNGTSSLVRDKSAK